MSKFNDTLSALGHFWPSDKPENRWPERVSVETFPRARLNCIGRAPGDGSPITGRLTLHGLTENNSSYDSPGLADWGCSGRTIAF
jgi:hypothetical protein